MRMGILLFKWRKGNAVRVPGLAYAYFRTLIFWITKQLLAAVPARNKSLVWLEILSIIAPRAWGTAPPLASDVDVIYLVLRKDWLRCSGMKTAADRSAETHHQHWREWLSVAARPRQNKQFDADKVGEGYELWLVVNEEQRWVNLIPSSLGSNNKGLELGSWF
jgi:hypothetical protein